MSRCFVGPVGILGTVAGTSVDFHGEGIAIHWVGTSDLATNTVTGDYRIDQGSCTGEAGTFVMTRQSP
jgi:hypothetical protein